MHVYGLSVCHSLAPKPPPNPNFAQQPMASILKAGLPTPGRPTAAPLPVKYAAAAAAAVQAPAQNTNAATASASSNQPGAPTAPSISTTATSSSTTQDQTSAATSSPSLTHPSVTSPMLSSAASVSAQPADGSLYSGRDDSPALSEAVPSSISGPAATSSPQRITSRKGMLSFTFCMLPNVPELTWPPSASVSSPTTFQSPNTSVCISIIFINLTLVTWVCSSHYRQIHNSHMSMARHNLHKRRNNRHCLPTRRYLSKCSHSPAAPQGAARTYHRAVHHQCLLQHSSSRSSHRVSRSLHRSSSRVRHKLRLSVRNDHHPRLHRNCLHKSNNSRHRGQARSPAHCLI